MKSILLKEELQRISEIMNISPKLIIEGITPSKAAEEFLGKLFGGKSSAEAADDILTKIRKGETGVADKAAASEAFEKLIEKEVYTDAERTFVTQIIDKLFPEFVKTENGKLIGLLNNVPNEGARSTLKSMLLDVAGSSDIEVAETINLLDSKFNVSPENIRMFRNKLKPRPIEIPGAPKPTSGVGSRESSIVSDELVIDFPFEIKPELENIARNAGIDVNGLLNSVQKESTTTSRVNEVTAYMAEQSAKLDLANKAEGLRLQKELNDLSVMNRQIDVKSNSLNKEKLELEVKQKQNNITHQEEMDLIAKKRELNKLASDRIDNFKKMKYIFITLSVIVGGITLIVKRCDWFPWACDFFSRKSKSSGKFDGL